VGRLESLPQVRGAPYFVGVVPVEAAAGSGSAFCSWELGVMEAVGLLSFFSEIGCFSDMGWFAWATFL
jgi:hypothetical protein